MNVTGKCKGKRSENMPLSCLHEKDSYNFEVVQKRKK